MIPFKYSISTNPKKKGNLYYVRMRVSVCGKAKDISLGFGVPVDCMKSGIVVNHEFADIYNQIILTAKKELQDIINDYQFVKNEIPDVEDILDRYNHKYESREPSKVVDLLQSFIEEQQVVRGWSVATIRKHNTVLNLLKEFDKNINLHRLDTHFLNKLVNYCIKTKQFANATTKKYISTLVQFLRCLDDFNEEQLKGFKLKLPNANSDANEVFFLTLEELKQLESLVIPSHMHGLNKTRDVFLFCCFSGLRHSDVKSLTKAQIYDDKIAIVTNKTTDVLYIDLNDKTRAILDKYKDINGSKALPVSSDQKCNENIKRLCKMAEIKRDVKVIKYVGNKRTETISPLCDVITFHSSRKTFITSALTLGINAEVVMKWTGHKDYEAMKPYIKIVDSLKRQEMNKFNTL